MLTFKGFLELFQGDASPWGDFAQDAGRSDFETADQLRQQVRGTAAEQAFNRVLRAFFLYRADSDEAQERQLQKLIQEREETDGIS
jgi:hypothetical protein